MAARSVLRDGYAKTTIATIAKDARVSVDTIYKSFGGKPGLIRAIRTRVLLGTGPIPAEQRSDEIQLHQPDPREIFRRWGEFGTEIAPIAAPILLLVCDAAGTHPELRRPLEEMDEDRLRRLTDNARRLVAAGELRHGITIAAAANVHLPYSAM